MKTLYEAANAVEAHMLQDFLKQEGISTAVQGAYLQGAIGDLPAAGLVRLVVDEAQYLEARAAIERWESANVSAPNSVPAPSKRPASRLWAALLGLAIGVAGSYAYFRLPVSDDGMDHNHDGVLDEHWHYSASGALIKTDIDSNFDGKVDYISHFNVKGDIQFADADENFDSVFESHLRYVDGNVDATDMDTDGDGFSDVKSHFKFGAIQSSEFISPISGHVLRVEFYELGKIKSADMDTNDDGIFDTRYSYGKLGEVVRTERIAPSAPQ